MTVTVGVDSICYNRSMRAGDLDLAGFLDRTVAHGAKAVQMDPLWRSQSLDLSDASLNRLRAMLQERGLHLVVKGNSGGLGSLLSPPEAAQEDVALFRSKIEAAAKLGAPVMRIVTRAYPYPTAHTMPPKGVRRHEVIGWVIANLKALTPVAEGLGVRIAVENHGDLRIAELERILKEVNSPALGVQCDLVEQVAIFEDPRWAAERLLPHAFTVHWSDAYPRLDEAGFSVRVCLPGEGLVDLDGIAQIIASLPQEVYVFTAFQAASAELEDAYVRAYVGDLNRRFGEGAR
ncbi:MAG: sugar phosphate isomerase/epimerase family protein [Anaerolineae bacterium]